MDSGCETTLVSALLDGRRVVALQVLCVSVETAHIVDILARDGIDLRRKGCEQLAKAPGKDARPVVDAVRRRGHAGR